MHLFKKYLLILYLITSDFQAVNSEDVISQLVIRTYDDNGKLKENIKGPKNGATCSKEGAPATDTVNIQISGGTMTILRCKDPTTVQTASNQEKTNLINNTKPILLETMKVDNAEVTDNVPNITAEQPKDASFIINEDTHNSIKSSTKQNPSNQLLQDEHSLSKPDENKSSLIQPQKNKPSSHVRKQTFNESKLLEDPSALDPLEFTSDLSCTDEFINTNLLDNPDFLKSFKPKSSNVSFCKNEAVITYDKTEDSDIEILENIGNSKMAEKNAENNEITKLKSSKQATTKEEQSDSCNTTGDKSTSKGTAADSDDAAAQPLTLEDIKDTGCTGLNLYKCGYTNCNFATTTAPLLKKHIKECSLNSAEKNLYCAHCTKRFIKIGFLLEHLKIHGLKRFGCSLCKIRYPVSYQATAHMKTKHKFPNTKLVPADPTNPSVDGLFIVQAIVSLFFITKCLSI